MKKANIPYGNETLVCVEMTEAEMAEKQLRIRPAGVYFLDNLVVRSDLTNWRIVDRKDVA